jgi:hypothetical protein
VHPVHAAVYSTMTPRRCHHFTVTIHNLPQGYNTIADFNAFLERNGLQAERREQRREGFEAGNADKIFEGAYSGQTTRRG